MTHIRPMPESLRDLMNLIDFDSLPPEVHASKPDGMPLEKYVGLLLHIAAHDLKDVTTNPEHARALRIILEAGRAGAFDS